MGCGSGVDLRYWRRSAVRWDVAEYVTVARTGGGRGRGTIFLSFRLPRKRAAYICSWRWKPGLGQTISRFDMTKSRASCGGMACAAMRYAQTTVAEREMPIAQCTCRGARGG